MDRFVSWFLVAAVVLWMSLGIKIGTNLPDHAVLLANIRTEKYVTVPCVIKNAVEQTYVENVQEVFEGTEEVRYDPFVEAMTKEEAVSLGLRPDIACANADGFIRFVPWLWSVLGLQKERVNANGDVIW